MKTRDAVQQFICDTDPLNEERGSYSPDQITPEFAAACLERNEFADGSPVDDRQRQILVAVRDRRETIQLD